MTLTAAEARETVRVLDECETVAGDLVDSREETRLEREGKEAALRAAESFKAAAELQQQRADAEAALKDQAREDLAAERKRGRWRAIRWAGAAGTVALIFGLIFGAAQ